MKERKYPAVTGRNHCDCCAVTKLEDGRCRVRLPTGGEFHAISGTLYQRNHGHQAKLADGIVFWSPPDDKIDLAAAVELKSGRVNVTTATGQLQNGANLINHMSHDKPRVTFMPILATRQLDAVELMMIERATVTFRGKRYQIVRVRRGTDLSTVMNQQGKHPKR